MSKFLLSSIEQNLDNFYLKCSNHSNFESMDTNHLKWVRAHNADWPSCIFYANFNDLDVDSEIKNVRSLINSEKAPDGWTVGPLTKPKSLGKKLLKYGFSEVFHQAGMAIDLLKIKLSPNINSSLIVKKIEYKEELDDWSQVVSSVFHITVDKELLEYLLPQNEVKFYIGIHKKVCVSALLLYLIPRVAGLHAVSTLPNFRNQNFAFTLSEKALRDARDMGYKFGVLQASSMGQFVYKKLGFKKHCDIFTYALNEE